MEAFSRSVGIRVGLMRWFLFLGNRTQANPAPALQSQKGVSAVPKDPNKKPPSIVTESHPNLEEEIRRLAYEFYEERGREDGHDLDDWLRAEAAITGTKVRAAAA
jgi:Protein of unknown function (DUF2934)